MLQILRKQIGRMTNPQIVALGYGLLIWVGAGLLYLPISQRGPGGLDFISCLFTATSATCVTGLVVGDTFQLFSGFGQAVIITLIQIGGLGFMTVLAMFGMFLRRRIGLRARTLLKDSVNTPYVGGIIRLCRKILIGTFCIEAVGAAILAIRFVPIFGWGKGLWYSVFHSISAFCNAGFDLMGVWQPGSSLVLWNDDPLILLTLSALILIGGIGFFVWDDVSRHGLRWRKYSLHTKLALFVTALVTLVGTVGLFLFEKENTLAGMPLWQQWLNAYFCAVTPRTAGFNTVANELLTDNGKLASVILMFIGGSPGGTAGGIKTTTLAVLLISAWNSLRSEADNNIFGRRLEPDALRQAVAVCTINLTLLLAATLAIGALQPQFALLDVMVETVSAISTVGMTVGVTGAAAVPVRLILIFLMYTGRCGSVSFALLFTENRTPRAARFPEEKINIG